MNHKQPAGWARYRVLASTIAAILGTTGFSEGASAQDQEGQSRSALDEVTVTGTRIRSDDFSSPQPTTVIDNQYMRNLGIVNLGEAVVQMPQNVSTNTPTAAAGGNFFNGSTIANLRGLNPFFGSRTLTLVDSRRHVPTNQGDGVDLNFIPTIIIDRFETVTGGASASYGSGAIAGVQNIIIDRNLEGIRAEVDFGQTEAGDGDDTHVGFGFGSSIGEDGHLVIGVEVQEMDGIDNCSHAREWCGRNVSVEDDQFVAPNTTPGAPPYPNAQGQFATGEPENIVTGGVTSAWRSINGLFWLPNLNGRVSNSGTPVNVQLNEAGTGLIPYNPGRSGDAFFDTEAIGGDGPEIYEFTTLRSNVDRNIGYGSYTLGINERLNFFVEASLGTVETHSPQAGLTTDNVCLQTDYAFADPSITGSTELQDFLVANEGGFPCNRTVFGQPLVNGVPTPANGIPFRKDWENQTDTYNDTQTDLTRLAFGFDGQFGESTWTWDAYYQYGESDRTQVVNHNRHLTRGNFGLDAVIDRDPASATFGQPICRINANPAYNPGGGDLPYRIESSGALAFRELAEGCQPINVFGTNTLSPEALAFGWGFLRENTVVEQEMVEFSASGEIFAGFGSAGPVRAAAGASFRSESIDNLAAQELPDVVRRDFLIQYGESFGGEVDVTEFFTEFDVPFHERFAVNAAYRRSGYDNTAGFGTGVEGAESSYDIDTRKISAQWDIVDAVRLRLTTSRDVRAPNFRELYYGQVFTPGGLFGFIDTSSFNNAADCLARGYTCNRDPAAWTLAGGLNVTPEKADTDTIGLVIQPPDSNFRFGADYYEIEITDAITPAQINLVRDMCFVSRDPAACGAITGELRDPNDPLGGFIDVATIRAEAFNFRAYEVSGLDLTADYVLDLDSGASFIVRMLASHTYEQIVQPSATPPAPGAPVLTRDIAGVNGQTNGFLADWAAAPDWTANITATYARGAFSLTGQMRYISDGKMDALRVGPADADYEAIIAAGRFPGGVESVSNNYVPAYSLFNLSGSYTFELAGGNTLNAYGVINNLFDKDPPLLGTGTGGTNPILFDTIGRTFRVGVRLSFE